MPNSRLVVVVEEVEVIVVVAVVVVLSLSSPANVLKSYHISEGISTNILVATYLVITVDLCDIVTCPIAAGLSNKADAFIYVAVTTRLCRRRILHYIGRIIHQDACLHLLGYYGKYVRLSQLLYSGRIMHLG